VARGRRLEKKEGKTCETRGLRSEMAKGQGLKYKRVKAKGLGLKFKKLKGEG
jgi:hypothetical protein